MSERQKRVHGKMDEFHSGPEAPGPIDPKTGQNVGHWVLSEEERNKGLVRPLRDTYVHEECGASTKMPPPIAETLARDPGYYGKMFCVNCKQYLPAGKKGVFVWQDGSKVGS